MKSDGKRTDLKAIVTYLRSLMMLKMLGRESKASGLRTQISSRCTILTSRTSAKSFKMCETRLEQTIRKVTRRLSSFTMQAMVQWQVSPLLLWIRRPRSSRPGILLSHSWGHLVLVRAHLSWESLIAVELNYLSSVVDLLWMIEKTQLRCKTTKTASWPSDVHQRKEFLAPQRLPPSTFRCFERFQTLKMARSICQGIDSIDGLQAVLGNTFFSLTMIFASNMLIGSLEENQ